MCETLCEEDCGSVEAGQTDTESELDSDVDLNKKSDQYVRSISLHSGMWFIPGTCELLI